MGRIHTVSCVISTDTAYEYPQEWYFLPIQPFLFSVSLLNQVSNCSGNNPGDDHQQLSAAEEAEG